MPVLDRIKNSTKSLDAEENSDVEDGLPKAVQLDKLIYALNEEHSSTFKPGPLRGGKSCWAEPDSSDFVVRSESYLKDRVKNPAGNQLFSLLNVDVFDDCGQGRLDNYASRHDSFPHKLIEKGESRFLFIVHIQSVYHIFATWAVPDDLESYDPVFFAMWTRFLENEDYRNDRFKVIANLEEAAWVVKKVLPHRKPALLARKVVHRCFKTSSYFEMDVDCSSSLADYLGRTCTSTASQLSIDLAFLIEARSKEELPERVMAVWRMCKPDLENARKVAKPSGEPLK